MVNMKLSGAVLLLAMSTLLSCSQDQQFVGKWVEPIPGGVIDGVQGFELKEDGTASSINMATLVYENWSVSGGKLILSGESIGNGVTGHFTDTMNIQKITEDSLILIRGEVTFAYTRFQGPVPIPEAKEEFRVVKGTLIWGHEAHSFKAEGDSLEYWVDDNTGVLEKDYQATVGDGAQPYTPVYVELKVRDMGKATDGFALDYDGVYRVEEVVSIKPVD